MTDPVWKVQVVSYVDGTVVKTLTAPTERQAERIERGLEINLNHELFYTLIVKDGGDVLE